MKTIGIFGGLGPESTAAYYEYITRKYYETRRDYAYPEIVIYSVNFKEYIDAGYDRPDAVKDAICRLHRAGADFVVASCNSIHIVYDRICDDLPIPWVSIMDATADEILRRGQRKVGLLGTIYTMSKGFYQRAFAKRGIETLTPSPKDQKRMNDIIFGELITAKVTPESKAFGLGLVDELASQGAEGVVLGCTEIPFLIQQADTSTPVYDTTVIHAQKALDLAME
ncbi:MAG TPA: amino acid racemase [Candidatus Brocadiia bacterium]|nr:amino acid racemase [Candidatus Brocadiia bacterium]